jgi:transcriptional regulator with XRE-family HTH domain
LSLFIAVQSYEYGEAFPSLETLDKLADFFNVSLDFLAGREPPKEDAGKINY